jgi:hypothetical protein
MIDYSIFCNWYSQQFRTPNKTCVEVLLGVLGQTLLDSPATANHSLAFATALDWNHREVGLCSIG